MATILSTDANAQGSGITTGIGLLLVTSGWTELVTSVFTMDEVTLPQAYTTSVDSAFNIGDSQQLATNMYLESAFSMGESITFLWTPATFIPAGFLMSEETSYFRTTNVESSFIIHDEFPLISQTTLLSSTIKMSEAITFIRTASLTSNMTIGDEQTLATIVNLVSNLLMSGGVETTNVSTTQELVSNMTMGEHLYPGLLELLVSTALFSDSIETVAVQLEILTSLFTITDLQLISATAEADLTSTFTMSDSQSFEGSTHNAFLVSTMEMGDVIWSPYFEAIAWVMNTESQSISPFANFDFSSIVEHEGKLFAASPDGIFEITGDKDINRDIAAHVEWGFQDFSIKERKRASDLYIGYTGGDLEAKLETYGDGQIVYNYGIEKRDAEAPRNNRFKIGRGFKSRWWKVTLSNLAGADFQVYDVALNIIPTKRRL
jgi:hypothetical protein